MTDKCREVKDETPVATPIKKYQPSNGTETMWFLGEYCDRCQCCNICKTLCKAMYMDIDDPKYPDAWRYDAQGQPTCEKFIERVRGPRRARTSPGQLEIDLSTGIIIFPRKYGKTAQTGKMHRRCK